MYRRMGKGLRRRHRELQIEAGGGIRHRTPRGKAERVVGARRAPANREISLAERAEQVGEGLQREDDAFPHREGEAQPGAEDDDAEGPLDLRGR